MVLDDLLTDVLNALSTHPFIVREDFSLNEFPNKGQEPCLSIRYRSNRKFFFNFHIPKGKSKTSDMAYARYLYNCSMSPGRESVEESDTVEGRQGLVTEIQEWVKRIHTNIVAAPIRRQFEEQSAVIDQMRERFEDWPDEPLSHDDIAQFREDLDQIKAELTSQLKQAISNKEELARKVDELGKDIEFLKQALGALTKRQWGETFSVRFHKWTRRFSLSLRPLAAGTRVLQGILPEGTADALDKVADTADGLAAAVEKMPSSDGHRKE